MKVKKAVVPVAGLGIRVMPLTLHQPKAMIGIVDRPIIHYVLDEIVAAGVREVISVTGPNQPEFKKYINYLESLPEWQRLKVKFEFVIQQEPLGNGDAVYAARSFIKDEPFLVCFGDDLLTDENPPLKTLVDLFQITNAPMVVLEPVPNHLVSNYGVVQSTPSPLAEDLHLITDVVEKPEISKAPSNLTIIGRYILTPAIFEMIRALYPYRGKEIALAHALKNYAADGGKLYGWHFRGKRLDAGSKLGILKAQVYFGLRHRDFGPEFQEYLNAPTREGQDQN